MIMILEIFIGIEETDGFMCNPSPDETSVCEAVLCSGAAPTYFR